VKLHEIDKTTNTKEFKDINKSVSNGKRGARDKNIRDGLVIY
jgi:hypothetical protein